MEVDAVHAGLGGIITASCGGHVVCEQPRAVEVLDVVRLAVEEIEYVEVETGLRIDLVGGARGKNGRGLRAHAVVLDQRSRAEVARVQRPRPGPEVLQRHAQGRDAVDRARNIAAYRIAVGELRA